LVAPHHGSKTSAIASFVTTVHPQYVLYATGYRNRYHFPHQPVVNAYQQLGTIQLNTVDTGAIHIRFEKGKMIAAPVIYRLAHHPYWCN
jgi:competence protein ComEC